MTDSFTHIEDVIIAFSRDKNAKSWSPLHVVALEFNERREWDKALKTVNQIMLLADDLRAVGSKTESDSIQAAAQLLLGVAWLGKGERSYAKDGFRRAADLYALAGLDYGHAVSLFALGMILQQEREWREVFRSYEQSLQYLLKTPPSEAKDSLRTKVEEANREALKAYEQSLIPKTESSVWSAAEIFEGNLLELYRTHRSEIDILNDRVALFLLAYMNHLGSITQYELRREVGVSTDKLEPILNELLNGQFIAESNHQVSLTHMGKRFLSEIGFTPTAQLKPLQRIQLRRKTDNFTGFPRIQLGLPVYSQSLAAGSGSWVRDEGIREYAYVEAETVLLDEKRYEILPLPGEDLKLHFADNRISYGVCEVDGNSMNQAGIDPGDYVLFCHPQGIAFSPNDRNIVVASIMISDEPHTVVKRYHRRIDTVILDSESTDPTWGSKSYPDSQIHFVGRVVAVLKKV